MPQLTGDGNKPKIAKSSKPTVQARFNDVTLALSQVYHDTSKWNAICLPLLGTLLLLFAVALIVVGATQNIEDLIIIGAIFSAGSLMFFFLLYLNVCRPVCKRNKVSNELYDERYGDDRVESVRVPEQLPDYGYMFDNDDYLSDNKPVPTESQLYGAHKSRSFLATPATAKDVNLVDEDMGTPPPPRVKSPLERMASPPPRPVLPNESSVLNSPASSSMTAHEKIDQLAKQDVQLIFTNSEDPDQSSSNSDGDPDRRIYTVH